MNPKVSENKKFERVDYSESLFPKGEYDCCTFINCNFYDTDLSNITFNECNFKECDLSLAKLSNSILNDIKFLNCKLLGVNFKDCNSLVLSVNFQDCSIKLSSFYRLKLKKTVFKNCNLQDVDFTDTDLTSSIFDNCDLLGAIFENTILEKADLVSSNNYSMDPERNKIKKAHFSRMGIIGLLNKYNIVIE